MHTRGPWRIGKAGGTVVSDELAEDALRGSDATDFYGGNLIGESIAKCNLPLIAAAPDLLALLIKLVDIEGPLPGNAEWARDVRAAIAKAQP